MIGQMPSEEDLLVRRRNLLRPGGRGGLANALGSNSRSGSLDGAFSFTSESNLNEGTASQEGGRFGSVSSFARAQSRQLEYEAAVALAATSLTSSSNSSANAHRRQETPAASSSFDDELNSRKTRLFWALYAFRALNSLLVSTWFDPDETWQSLEVAHQMVFGVGALTWEWRMGIRGAAHPLMFAAFYKLLQITGLEHTSALVYGPRFIQAFFSASTDFFTYYLSLRLFGSASAHLTLMCMMMSWFTFYCGIRTYSNSMEASMTMIALYYWPAPRTPPASRSDLRIALGFAALGCLFRPNNALVWIFLTLELLKAYPHRFFAVIADSFTTGFAIISISLCVDRIYYDKWVATPWQFLYVNVVENISQFYGVHPVHWYFTQAIPLVLFTSLPFALYGAYRVKLSHKRQMFWMCLFVTLILSLIGHKEFRFLLPLVAPMQIYAGRALYLLQKADTKQGRVGWKSKYKQSLTFLLFSNLFLGLYFCRVHKRGVIEVVLWLREQAYQDNVGSVLFLMPCHSTPFFSHIHLDISMRYITCEPPLGIPPADRRSYKDETDILYGNPQLFLQNYFSRHLGNKTLEGPHFPPASVFVPENQTYTILQYQWPSHLVWYDNEALAPHLKPLLKGSDYKECKRFFNSHFHDDSKQTGDLVVSCRNLR